MGTHLVQVAFTTPLEKLFQDLFTVTVNDPCTQPHLQYSKAFTPPLADYQMGEQPLQYSLSFTDTVQPLFGGEQVCGGLDFISYQEVTSVLGFNLFKVVLVEQLESSGPISVSVGSTAYEDLYLIEKDEVITIQINLRNAQLDESFVQSFDLTLLYSDPCVIQPSHITPAPIPTVVYAVDAPQQVKEPFTFTSHDCLATCGSVTS